MTPQAWRADTCPYDVDVVVDVVVMSLAGNIVAHTRLQVFVNAPGR
jgi:hypothetical protein